MTRFLDWSLFKVGRVPHEAFLELVPFDYAVNLEFAAFDFVIFLFWSCHFFWVRAFFLQRLQLQILTINFLNATITFLLGRTRLHYRKNNVFKITRLLFPEKCTYTSAYFKYSPQLRSCTTTHRIPPWSSFGKHLQFKIFFGIVWRSNARCHSKLGSSRKSSGSRSNATQTVHRNTLHKIRRKKYENKSSKYNSNGRNN